MKKAISAATSAALLASLLATAVAPSAFAAITVGSAGNVPVGGTSANTVSFTFTEASAAAIANASGSFTVTILDSASANTLSFSGTPSVAGSTGALGASASLFAPNVLLIKIGGSDTANVDSIIVTGLKIKASSTAATGAIKATMGTFTGSITSAAVFTSSGTATGYISNAIVPGATSVIVATTSASCLFTSGGTLAFATTPESVTLTTANPNGPTNVGFPANGVPVAGEQTLTIGATASNHLANEIVTESVSGCGGSPVLASPGTVVAALTYNTPNNPVVYPGENNSPADPLVLVEPAFGFLPTSSTITYKIATPGVVFSSVPTASVVNSVNEVQTVTVTNVAATTFTLTYAAATTVAIPADGTETAAQVQAALVALAPIGVGNVTVSGAAGGPFTVTFVGTLAAQNVAQMTSSANAAVATSVNGSTASGMVVSGAVLSADRTSVTVTISTASSVSAATITLSNILYDVASTVPVGTYISVGVTTSGGLAVLPASNTNAVVFRGIAASAPSPTVYIGENNQAAGIITFTESQAGFFTAGTGTGTNVFSVCPAVGNYTFTVAPYAQVVGGTAAGNLILRDGSAASTTNLVQGLVGNGGCFTWYIWSASTTPSTIKIGGAGLTAGAPINVTVAQAPGGVIANLFDGNSNTTQTLFATVQFATAVYRNQVAVTALSQPSFAAGTNHGAGGNVQIAETGLGQLKAGENICFEVLYRSGEYQDQFLNGLNTADLPVAAASGTGLVISPVNASFNRSCNSDIVNIPNGYMTSFAFTVLQQSTAGDGKIVISNISYTTLTAASSGPVQLSVWGFGGAPTSVIFHSTVSNATVGTMPTLSIGAVSALGLKPTSGYSTKSLKTQTVGKYVTWKFTGGAALAGQHVTIWVTTATIPGVWGAWKPLTARVADANGIATFWWKSAKKTSISVRAEWMGNATYGDSLSPARGATWK